MGAADELRVEGCETEKAAEAELLAKEEGGDAQPRETDGGIDEKLAGVVARLAVDIDGAGEVGRAGIVEPVVVGEPAVVVGN